MQHSLEVARKRLEIASRVKIPVDKHLIARGAIFHDLGKAKTYGMEHGEIGAKMAEELGLEEAIRQIILKHIRGGLTEAEAKELGLPVRDYTLRTPEEKIVIYADRMVDIYTDGIVPDTNEKKAEDTVCRNPHHLRQIRKESDHVAALPGPAYGNPGLDGLITLAPERQPFRGPPMTATMNPVNSETLSCSFPPE